MDRDIDEFFAPCNEKEKNLSCTLMDLLGSELVTRLRLSHNNKALLIELQDGRKLYVDANQDKLDVSVH